MTSTSTVNKDASEAGSHCHTCGALDFLPFTCLLCRATFCKDHSSQAKRPEDHDCPQAATAPAGPAVAREYSGNEVKFRDLLPDRSSPVVQVTPAQLEKDQKRQAALALLHKNFPGTSTSSTSAKSNTARASGATVGPAQKKILLMKLRQRGKPGDRRRNEGQVPMKERRYFVAVDDATGKTADLWLPQVSARRKHRKLSHELLGGDTDTV